MSHPPWAADRPLEIRTIRDLLTAQFPHVRGQIVKPIGTGWDFDTYEIDERWIFRFPRRQEYDGRFLAELALLDIIAGKIPVPVPRYTFRGQPSELFPYHFGGYPKLAGTQATEVSLDGPARDMAAGQLADALNYLCACNVEPLV